VRKDACGPARVWRPATVALAGVSSVLALAISVARGSTAAPGERSASAAVATLSNLRTLSRWAYPQVAAAAHQYPSARSRVVGHLRFLTIDGQAQVYLTLRSYTTRRAKWILVPIPGRPNGVSGWVPAGALGEMHVTHEYLRINREKLSAALYRDGRLIWSAPVGIGRPSLPTPAGHFYITEKLTALGGPFYGPFALGTSAYASSSSEWPAGDIVGIHGTDEPQLIPGRPSHGCVRLRNSSIERLWPVIEVGTPVEII
jgi:hypothetical protein